jgi:hypothetical protein
VRPRGTTRCCSALALTVACSLSFPASGQQIRPFPSPRASQSRADKKPLSLFPVHTLWTLELNNQIVAPPAFDDIHGFFPIEGNRIVAYDLAAGTQVWIGDAVTKSRPAVGENLLFLLQPDTLTALRIADGSTAWQLPFGDPLAAPLVWDNGWLIAATIDGSVLAFRGSDGHLVWRHQIGSPAHALPALAADRVYVPTEDGRVVSLRVDTGALVWEHRLGGAASDLLALDDRVYAGSKDNFFYSLDARNGELKTPPWRTGADVVGMPILDARNVYFVSLDNVMRALHRSNGNQEWVRPLPVRPTSGPIKAGEAILVAGTAASLPAFNVKDGAHAGDVSAGGEIEPLATPHVINAPGIFGPVLIIVTRDIVKGATVSAWARSLDPEGQISVAPLPNSLSVTPTGMAPTIIPKP